MYRRLRLRRAIARISPAPELEGSVDHDDVPEGIAAQVHAEAVETTAAQLIHEIEPLLGGLRLAAKSEVPNFNESSTRRAIDRLDEFLEVLSRLRRAASAPKMEEFSLDDVVQHCIQEAGCPEGVQIVRSGPQPCIVEGDRSSSDERSPTCRRSYGCCWRRGALLIETNGFRQSTLELASKVTCSGRSTSARQLRRTIWAWASRLQTRQSRPWADACCWCPTSAVGDLRCVGRSSRCRVKNAFAASVPIPKFVGLAQAVIPSVAR